MIFFFKKIPSPPHVLYTLLDTEKRSILAKVGRGTKLPSLMEFIIYDDKSAK